MTLSLYRRASAPRLGAGALLGLLLAGCSYPGRTPLERRAADLADCVEVSVGAGKLLPYVRLRVTDYLVAGAGAGGAMTYGWHGRHGATGYTAPMEAGQGLPLIYNSEYGGSPPAITTYGPCVTTRDYGMEPKPGPRTLLADRFWIGASGLWLLSARVGVNPVEFADFVAGWFGSDPLADDGDGLMDWWAQAARRREQLIEKLKEQQRQKGEPTEPGTEPEAPPQQEEQP